VLHARHKRHLYGNPPFLTISGILGATVKPVINVMGSLGEANHRKKMQQQFP
jgi:hypothetical protein